jgi:N-acetylmuramoyl-L-alanine amidase
MTTLALDLEKPLKPSSFTLTPNQQYGHRLVLDLETGIEEAASENENENENENEKQAILALFEADTPHPDLTAKISPKETKKSAPKVKKTSLSKDKTPIPIKTVVSKPDFIVAIDPGHGGEDPGAIGPCGTREKDIVLSIARYLKEMIDKEPGMKSVLIRSGDYYVGLQDRVARARKHKADLFVSIHADAFPDKRAEGASVFTVSEKAASSTAAKWLADRENRSDLVGGVSLANKNQVLASVLLDLSQTASKEEGLHAAKHVLKSLNKVGSLHSRRVEQAGFAVLKAPDVPSVLVETGFISHPHSEKKLKTAQHQKKLASAIMAGIREYHNKRIKIAMQ